MEDSYGRLHRNIDVREIKQVVNILHIHLCLKIYDLLRHPHLWVGVWVNGLCQVK